MEFRLEGFVLRRGMKKLIDSFGVWVCKLAAIVWNYGILRYSIYEVDWRDISKGEFKLYIKSDIVRNKFK